MSDSRASLHAWPARSCLSPVCRTVPSPKGFSTFRAPSSAPWEATCRGCRDDRGSDPTPVAPPGARADATTGGRVRMERLSAQDAGFLYTETPETPMHVGTLTVFAPTQSSLETILQK